MQKILTPHGTGLVWSFTFVILEAAQAVFFGSLFQRVDSFLVGLIVFGTTSAIALGWVALLVPSQLSRAISQPASLLGMNVTASGGWIAYLLAIQLIEPTIAFAIFSGMVPLTTIAAARLRVLEASGSRNKLEASGNLIVGVSLLLMGGATALGLSGFVRGGGAVAVAGVGLAALSGALITWMLFYCRRLDSTGVGPMAQFGLRFLLYLPLSAGGLLLGLDEKEESAATDLVAVLAVGVVLMAFPIYAVQRAVSLVTPLTIATITALGPLFVFVFQTIEGRIGYSYATLVGLAIYFAGSILATIGGGLATRISERQAA